MSGDYYSTGATSSVTTSSAASSRWLTEEVFKLIEMVQRDEAIYNPRHKYYFCRPYVENFWREVDLKLEKNPGASLAKWTNLRISFRREYTNYLEEKVPPCWTYFDRMFFLHPYLRKKQQQPKSLDSQVQDALVQISSLSSRLQRVTAANAAAASLSANSGVHGIHVQTAQPPLDNYLEYIDEPEQHNSELDEIIDEEQQTRFQNMENHSVNNDIKSECDENVDDFDADVRNETDEHEPADAEVDADDTDMHRFVLDSLASNVAEQTMQQKQQRLQHLNRLQTRSFHEELRSKRPRSQESSSSNTVQLGCNNNVHHAHHTQRMICPSTPTQHSNVSFVRPTFAKPIDYACSSTTSSTNHNVSGHNNSTNSIHAQQKLDAESNNTMSMTVPAIPSSSSFTASNLSHHHLQTTPSGRHLPHHHHHHRLEISSVSSGTSTTSKIFPDSGASRAITPTSNHAELCDCKTDPDAMFLMSLLPDIQKLNGRDRGKIKIAFQNILQDYLYPD